MSARTKRLPEFLAVLLAFVAGLMVFGNYFFPRSFLTAPTQFLLKAVILVSGAALLMASFNLAWRHAKRATRKDVGSLLVVGGFIVAFVAGMMPEGFQAGIGGWLYQWLLAPGMAAMFALLPIFLAYALFRHLKLQDVGGFLLFLGMIAVLLGQIPALVAPFPWLSIFRHNLLVVPAPAAFRGVILGLATGVILAVFLKLFPRSHAPLHSEESEEEQS